MRWLWLPWTLTGLVLGVLPASAQDSAPNVAHQHWIAEVVASDLDIHVIHVSDMPAPSQMQPDPWESRAAVGSTTSATFRLTYEAVDGDRHELVAHLQIDNITGELSSDGRPVSTLADVFGDLPVAPDTGGRAVVQANFTQPVYLEIDGTTAYQITVYVTDAGEPVEVWDAGGHGELTQEQADAILDSLGLSDKVVHTGPPSDSYDCHGWTFTNGEKWINNDQVQKILDDNGYVGVPSGQVQVGDLVVYRDEYGNITHTGIVTAVDENGNPTEIESKWGSLGRYRHAPGDVPPGYGEPEYHRSNRPNGHQLEKIELEGARLLLLWLLLWLLEWLMRVFALV